MSAERIDPDRIERVAVSLGLAMKLGNSEPYSLAMSLELSGVLDTPPVTELAAAVDALGALPMPTGSREDSHDSPLHQSYALPHDLPEFLAHLSGGDLPADAVREKRCLLPPIGCGRALVDSVAVTATESAEYRITGLCPTCQDVLEAGTPL